MCCIDRLNPQIITAPAVRHRACPEQSVPVRRLDLDAARGMARHGHTRGHDRDRQYIRRGGLSERSRCDHRDLRLRLRRPGRDLGVRDFRRDTRDLGAARDPDDRRGRYRRGQAAANLVGIVLLGEPG